MKIRFVRTDPSVVIPKYAHDTDAAFDLASNEEYVLKPGEHKVFKSGLKLEIPIGYVGNIRDRSGLAAKNAIHTMAGIIDSGYRGEIGIVLINLGKSDFHVEKGMRIAQMLIQKIENVDFQEAEELSDTDRGAGGFGSSGHK